MQAWKKSPDSLKIQAEQSFDCCGLGLDTSKAPDAQVTLEPSQEDMKFSIDNHVFDKFPTAKCYHAPPIPTNGTIPVPNGCQTCYSLISDKVTSAPQSVKYSVTNLQVNSGFNGAGGLGLFFSFSEVGLDQLPLLTLALPCHQCVSSLIINKHVTTWFSADWCDLYSQVQTLYQGYGRVRINWYTLQCCNSMSFSQSMTWVQLSPNMQDHFWIHSPLKLIRATMTSAHMSRPFELWNFASHESWLVFHCHAFCTW